MAFELDTSGTVMIPHEMATRNGWKLFTRWSDLTPFTQGYIEALFATPHPHSSTGTPIGEILGTAKFSDLSPEALALILRDCEARRAQPACVESTREAGRSFWVRRQAGDRPGFPPLTVSLADDGKIHLRSAETTS